MKPSCASTSTFIGDQSHHSAASVSTRAVVKSKQTTTPTDHVPRKQRSNKLRELRRSLSHNHSWVEEERFHYGYASLNDLKLNSWIDAKPQSLNASFTCGDSEELIKLEDKNTDHLHRRVVSMSKRRVVRTWSGSVDTRNQHHTILCSNHCSGSSSNHLKNLQSLIDTHPRKHSPGPSVAATTGGVVGSTNDGSKHRTKPRRFSGEHGICCCLSKHENRCMIWTNDFLLDEDTHVVRMVVLEKKLRMRPQIKDFANMQDEELVKAIKECKISIGAIRAPPASRGVYRAFSAGAKSA